MDARAGGGGEQTIGRCSISPDNGVCCAHVLLLFSIYRRRSAGGRGGGGGALLPAFFILVYTAAARRECARGNLTMCASAQDECFASFLAVRDISRCDVQSLIPDYGPEESATDAAVCVPLAMLDLFVGFCVVPCGVSSWIHLFVAQTCERCCYFIFYREKT